MKIFDGVTNPACKPAFAVVMADKRYFAFLLITGTGAEHLALANRADALTVGKDWRVVAVDRGCGAMTAVEWQALIAGHAGAVGVMLDDGVHADGKRHAVDWLTADALEYRIEEAFSKAETGGSE